MEERLAPASPALPGRRPSRPPPPSSSPSQAAAVKLTTFGGTPIARAISPPPAVAPLKEELPSSPSRKTFLNSIRKGSRKGTTMRGSGGSGSGAETESGKPLAASDRASDAYSFSPIASPVVRHVLPTKRYRKVPIGEAHHHFLSMFVYCCCGGGRRFLATRALQRGETIEVVGEAQQCSAPASDAFVLAWFAELLARGGELLPLAGWTAEADAAILPIAKQAYEALVARSHLLKQYDDLGEVTTEQLAAEAALLVSLEEILRRPGSAAAAFPRDRFNPYTHTPSETTEHQRRAAHLANYRLPYLVVNLTVALLRTGALEAEGLFRVNADSHALENLKRFIVTDNWAEVAAVDDINVLSGALKSYFASLSGGMLFPPADTLLQLGSACEWPAVSSVLRKLPEANLLLIWWWVTFCRLVAAHESTTSMGLKQLVVCWAPCLVHQDFNSGTLQEIALAGATIQAVLLCTLQSHPPHPLFGRARDFSDSSWFPVSAADFFATFAKPRDPEAEDFVEVEEQYGSILLDEDNDYKGLMDLLEQVPNHLLNECCDALFPYLWRRRCFFGVFQALVERDVEQTKFINSLFRLNSYVTKLLKSVIALEGGAFLKGVLGPIVKDISRQNAEMDASAAPDEAERQQRANLLSECCSMALCTITNSMGDIPPPLRRVAEVLGRAVVRKWPEHEEAVPFAMSAFFFLRFVCPYFFNVPSSTPGNAAFTSRQIAKMLQAMANGGELVQADWPKFNIELLSVHCARLDFFLRQMAIPSDQDVDYSKVSEDEAINGFEIFVKLLRQHLTTLPEELTKGGKPAKAEDV